ncbi:MAG: FHA domain-containing protein [Oscillospiraceae bacterium]|nr:FHA domain-containing protein [Oscillospiraceae bacterium]
MTFTTAFVIRAAMFILLLIILTVSVVSLFIRPAKRTIKATLVDDFDGGLIDISHAETSIGKAKTCDIVLTYMSVSRFHAVLSNSQNGWMIYDTHSSYGTFVNGKAIDKKSELKSGDVIQIGAGEFTFYDGDPPASRASGGRAKNVKVSKRRLPRDERTCGNTGRNAGTPERRRERRTR